MDPELPHACVQRTEMLAGVVPARTKYVVNTSGVYYNFARTDGAAITCHDAVVGLRQAC